MIVQSILLTIFILFLSEIIFIIRMQFNKNFLLENFYFYKKIITIKQVCDLEILKYFHFCYIFLEIFHLYFLDISWTLKHIYMPDNFVSDYKLFYLEDIYFFHRRFSRYLTTINILKIYHVENQLFLIWIIFYYSW